MRRLALLAPCLVLLGGCQYVTLYAETGVGGKLPTSSFDGRQPTAVFHVGAEREIEPGWVLKAEYEHLSHWRDGVPFNTREENFVDSINILLRYEFGGPPK